jgi:hypothetical protein
MQPQRRRLKQLKSLKQRLIEQAKRLREEAKLKGPGVDRETFLRKARQAQTAAHIDEWLSSPGLRSPK